MRFSSTYTYGNNDNSCFLYVKANHLGNTRAVVTKNTSTGLAETVSYTDYYPHGGVMPGRNYQNSLGLPYAYQGQEKDAETNLLNFELRQYDARLGRWYNPDPYGQHHSPYLSMSNNPVSYIDPDGGRDVNGGVNSDPTYGGDDAMRDAQWANGFSNQASGDAFLEAYALSAHVNDAYNQYKRDHKHNGEWGDWVYGAQSVRDLDDNNSKIFVIDPSKKIEDPHVNQNRLKFAKLSYEDSPWYRTKIDVFGSNALRSAWNSIIDLPETAKSLFTSQGLKNLYNTPGNLIVNSVKWFATTDNNQKAKDVVSASEDIAGGFIIGFGVGRLSTISNGLKIGVNPEVLSVKPLRAKGTGKINGFSISKGKGYGAKPRFDVHPLSRPSKKTASFPSWIKGQTLPHYHRGKGNNLHRHRPFEIWPSDKNFWSRF